MLIRQPSSNIPGRRSNTLILDFFIPVEQGVEGAVHHPFTFVVRHRCTRPNHAAASCRCWTRKPTPGRRTAAPVQHLGQYTSVPFEPPETSKPAPSRANSWMTPEESASIARGGSPEAVDEPNDIAPDGAGVDSMRGREHSDGQAGVPKLRSSRMVRCLHRWLSPSLMLGSKAISTRNIRRCENARTTRRLPPTERVRKSIQYLPQELHPRRC
ncbi:hypothetical protein RB10871 [Rhodopirellula baltica SH 1]|uniref:Uncharacterized protein n=1 Tax=Rhodopirellula baltica (strain DSM 10527 / NCIMB 13988 / SH1) TaxID=243090 RepID=Q7UK45_RHOBA|nr:hypothetical protein RB10871 [Rhodopirellula baltica SH 1]